ncbi:hypothetical protein AB0M39_01950 [Streptomyces sp. NPDC051907]|uniref:hypothetical protein n=1 Tax=Streptomyces sp. NPDC051907 TaxID=3155284 RepID=UPI00343C5DEC
MDVNQGEADVDPVGRAIAYVCGQLDDIRQQLDEAGDTGPLDGLLAALRAGGEVDSLIHALHGALQRSGDALGVYGNVRRAAVPRTLGDFSRIRPRDTVYLCPDRRCARYVLSPRAEAPPVCDIGGSPMLSERL